MIESTGHTDRYGNDICVGDYVKFRAHGISGRGVVFKPTDTESIQQYGKYMIQDIRKYPECKSKNEGRQYPFYDDAIYTVLAENRR